MCGQSRRTLSDCNRQRESHSTVFANGLGRTSTANSNPGFWDRSSLSKLRRSTGLCWRFARSLNCPQLRRVSVFFSSLYLTGCSSGLDWTGLDSSPLRRAAGNGVSAGNRFTQLPFETTAIDVTDELAYCYWYRGSISCAATHREIRLGGGQRAQLQRLSCSSASVSGPRSHCTIHVPCDTFSGVYRCISGCNKKDLCRGSL